jgi:hypothetical protein
MEGKDQRYNGWTNYETWAVALWLGNDETTCDYWADVADECKAEAPNSEQVESGIWTVGEAARYKLAERLKEDIESGSPLEEASMYSDLLNSAIQSVNWNEIASTQLEEDE